MARTIYLAALAAVLPIASAAGADSPVCHPSHASHSHHVVAHRASGVGVAIDEARVIAFAGPVDAVYVGNPVIADVTMIDRKHGFILGKTLGVTNLIALTPDGKLISDQQVTVYNINAAVTVNRGADQFNYVCTRAHCETAPRPGDPKAYVDNTEGAATGHEAAGAGAATTAGPATGTPGQ